jgi:MFS family permease
MIIIILFMPSSSVTHSQRGVDVQGTLSLMVTLSCFMAAITLAQMNVLELPFILVLMGLTVVGLAAFLWIESTQTDPMLDLTLFQSIPLSAGLALRLMGNLCIAAIIFILPFFLELVQHYPPDRAGLLLAIPPIIISIFAPLSGLTSDWIGGRTVSLVGLGLICLSCVFLGSMDESSSLTFYGIAVVPYALGVALFQSPNNNTIMGAVSRQHLGIAAGLLSLARILGQSIGIPLSGLIFSRMVLSGLDGELSVLDASVSALVMGSRTAFWSMAVLLSGGTLVIAGLWFWFESKLPSRSDG